MGIRIHKYLGFILAPERRLNLTASLQKVTQELYSKKNEVKEESKNDDNVVDADYKDVS